MSFCKNNERYKCGVYVKRPDKKKIVITKKLNNVLYEMIPKTHADMVYVDKKYSVTLTEKLYDMCELLQTRKEDIDDIRKGYNEIIGDAPDNFNTFKEVWDYEYYGDERTVDAHIKKLRQKIEKAGPQVIQTVWGVGYKSDDSEVEHQ